MKKNTKITIGVGMKKNTKIMIGVAIAAIITGIVLYVKMKKNATTQAAFNKYSTPSKATSKTATSKSTVASKSSSTQPAGSITLSTNTTLKNGSTGSGVTALQSALSALGYTVGTIDGDFGSNTESAVKTFQTANGLTVDGVAGPITLAAINNQSSQSLIERV